jgi:hypothetical protein
MALRRAFRKVTPAEVASKELADAEMELLVGLTHRDHAQASIGYNEARIKRLRAFLAKLEGTV